MATKRWLSMCVGGALLFGACGSDANTASSVTNTTGPHGDTTITVASVATTTTTTTTTTTAESADAPAATTDATISDATTEGTASDTVGSLPFLIATVDDVPVCQAFGRIITTSFIVGFAGIAPSDGKTAGVERVEVVVYAALTGDVATIRSDVPAELLPSLEPLLIRVDASPGALAAGGFTDGEIAAIATAWNDSLAAIAAGALDKPQPGSTLDQSKLDAASAAFLEAVGSFKDFSEADNSSAMDEAGNAWLKATCPLISASLGES